MWPTLSAGWSDPHPCCGLWHVFKPLWLAFLFAVAKLSVKVEITSRTSQMPKLQFCRTMQFIQGQTGSKWRRVTCTQVSESTGLKVVTAAKTKPAYWALIRHQASDPGCCHHLAAKSYQTLLQPHKLWPARLLCPWDFPGKNTGVGCHFLLQGIFPTQGSNPCLLHWEVDSLPPSHQRAFSVILMILQTRYH